MTSESRSTPCVQTKRSKLGFVIPATVLLVVLAAAVLVVSNTRVVSISGEGETFILEPGQTRLGILTIEKGAAATFHEKSRWIGPVVSKEGLLTVEDGVTITGPVVLFSNGLHLGERATVRGSVVLFSGVLTLERGASVRGNAVLFAGGASLAEQASIRGHVISFSGPVELRNKAILRGSAVLFAQGMKLGPEAAVYGKVVSFAGSLDLGPKAVLRDGAVVFSGNLHLFPEAQVQHDVILTEGDATLDGSSRIAGRLYLGQASISGGGRLLQASEAQITGGAVKPEDTESMASRTIGGWLVLQLVRLAALPLVGIGTLMALMFYLGWRSRSRRVEREASLRLEPTAQA